MKILVPTDFSDNSKAALYFAASLAKQIPNTAVVFYSAVALMQPDTWNLSFYQEYEKEEKKRLTQSLEKWVKSTLGSQLKNMSSCKYQIDFVTGTEQAIIQASLKNKCQFICIATNGASVLRKLMGTHTAYLVNHSSIPVLAIPSKYKASPLQSILYVSDFENLNNELKKLSSITSALKANIKVLHYARMGVNHPETKKKAALLAQEKYQHITPVILPTHLESSLIERLTKFIKKEKPGLVVLFTKQKKGFFERLFLPSKSAELTYSTKVPTLIFPK
ncbi:universal stress protein [Sediminibacterium salmoneum]|uniref:universal stress protein n=1 Tax=Sediminibacterium salmoneum TaxID=426421 RepID=UPI000479B8FF|nr:universal stress protein [Sediminibacterium salmoneum]